MRIDNAEVAISTIGTRITDALRLARQLCEVLDVIVVHQIPDGNDHGAAQLLSTLDVESRHLRYVTCNEAGVARSRNTAIRMAKKTYLWFLDDDVSVNTAECEKFFTDIPCPDADVITIDAQRSPVGKGKRGKITARRHNRFSILSIGTIEIIIRPDKVRELDCWFPEDMGAGTRLPISDEPVFLACCINKKMVVTFQPVHLVSHPHPSSGSHFLEPSHCLARGLAFARIFGPLTGSLFLILLYLKHAPHCLAEHGIGGLLRGIWVSLQGIRLVHSTEQELFPD